MWDGIKIDMMYFGSYKCCLAELATMPSPSRTLLLRGGSQQRLWAWHRGVPLQGLSVRGGQDLRHQRWSDAVSGESPTFSSLVERWLLQLTSLTRWMFPPAVGVPGGPMRGHRHGGPFVGGPLPAPPGVWRFWNRGLPGPQTNEGQLERLRLPHKRQHLADEGRGRPEVSSLFLQVCLEKCLSVWKYWHA